MNPSELDYAIERPAPISRHGLATSSLSINWRPPVFLRSIVSYSLSLIFHTRSFRMFSFTRVLRKSSTTERTPLIRFLGKRSIPDSVDHQPKVHPASPTQVLPSDFTLSKKTPSFSSYRQQAQQHGPLGRIKNNCDGSIGSISGSSLGPVTQSEGQFFDRNELPPRFHRTPIDLTEIDAIETGGATLVC